MAVIAAATTGFAGEQAGGYSIPAIAHATNPRWFSMLISNGSMARQPITSSLESSEALPALCACRVSRRRNMLCRMAESIPEPMAIPHVTAPDRFSKARFIIIKAIALTALTLVLGFAQGWASSRCYKPDHVAGFHMGLLHGILMPAALPGLLMGQNLPIYAPNNSGRPYNIGYIFGINTCGTIFFGVAFWRPRRR
jgi:hypothetical protein